MLNQIVHIINQGQTKGTTKPQTCPLAKDDWKDRWFIISSSETVNKMAALGATSGDISSADT